MKHVMFRFSTNLKSAGYDPATQTLEIQFRCKPGRPAPTYQYFDVPQEVADALMATNKPGTYHGEHIKDQYRFERVERVKPDQPALRMDTEAIPDYFDDAAPGVFASVFLTGNHKRRT